MLGNQSQAFIKKFALCVLAPLDNPHLCRQRVAILDMRLVQALGLRESR